MFKLSIVQSYVCWEANKDEAQYTSLLVLEISFLTVMLLGYLLSLAKMDTIVGHLMKTEHMSNVL